ERLLRAVVGRVLPVFRPRPEEARLCQAGRAGDASGADEPRCRDRLDGGGRRAIADPRTGGNGSGGADGGARSTRPQPAQRLVREMRSSYGGSASPSGNFAFENALGQI